MKRKKMRTWVYVQQPAIYGIECEVCGNHKITWSEYEHMIFCYDCNVDTPGTGGIFDGPIPYELTQMTGISFDRIDLKTGKRLYLKITDDGIVWKEIP